MKNFTYRSQDEKDNIEEILRQRQRKVNRQQLVASTILAILLIIVGLYMGRKVVYTEFDGYVHVDANLVRTPFDVFLDSMYVESGDVVMPGDTLYSYFMMDLLTDNANINTEPDIVARNRDLTLRYNTLAQQIAVQRVKIAELRKQIALENHNIQFGLSDNSHRMDLERLLAQAIAELNAMTREAAMVSGMRNATDPASRGIVSVGGAGNADQVYDNIRSKAMQYARRYRLATDSAIIVNISAPDRMVFFEKETILVAQHLNLTDNNLHIVAYIPPDKIKNITYNSLAEIVVNENLSFDAHVAIIGMRTEEIPEYLRSYFTKKNTALIAELAIDHDQRIPFWSVAAGLPVTIRIRNLETWQDDAPSNYLWVTTGKGVNPESLDEYLGRRRRYSALDRHEAEIKADSVRQAIADSIRTARQLREDAGRGQEAPAPGEPAAAQPAPVSPGPDRSATDPSQGVADGRYCIVTNVFQSEARADNRIKVLPSVGVDGATKVNVGHKWYVCARRFASRSDAQVYLNSLARKHRDLSDAWILDLEK